MSGKSAYMGGAVVGVMLAFGLQSANAKTAKRAHVAPPSPMEQKVDAPHGDGPGAGDPLDEETRARQALETSAAAATAAADASHAEALAARAELDDRIRTIPAPSPAAAAEGAAAAPLKGITITPGGFLAAESIYRSKNEASDISSSFSKIPFDNSALAHTNELRGTARQTRLSLLVQGDVDPDHPRGLSTASSTSRPAPRPPIRTRAIRTIRASATSTGRWIGTGSACTCWRARPGRW